MIAGTVVGMIAGAVSVLVAGARHPGIATDFDADVPAYLTGFYASERVGDVSFAWTSARASVRLPGLDRTRAWSCTIRLRGARADAASLPTVAIAIDGANAMSVATTNEFADVVIPIPTRAEARGLTVSLMSLPTFKPGGGDPRELGIQVDRAACRPEGEWAWAPRRAVSSVAAAGAAFGGAVALIGGSMAAIVIAVVVMTAGLAVLVSSTGAAFGEFPTTMAWVVIVVSGVMIATGRVFGALRKRELDRVAVAAFACASVVFVLRLLALWHPAKPTVDALFQAHRLEWVMAGRYFFTQPMPSGVAFPYAIGLYVFAMPWASLTTNHVALLRAVVTAIDVTAGIGLCVAMARAWREQAAGVVAMAFAAMAPLPFVVEGNGNLPNAFGQSVALLGLAAIAAGVLSRRTMATGAGLAAVLTLALVSHVSTLTLLLSVLGLVAMGFWWLGRPLLTREAVAVGVATVVAVLLAFGLYYRHFTDVYREAVARVLSPTAAAPAAPAPLPPSDARSQIAALTRPLTWTERADDALTQSIDAVGWPLLMLAAIGAHRAWRRGLRDRLSLLVLAWLAVWLLFVVAGTMTRVDVQYQRYAAEFVGRVNLATYPAIVVLAASGLTWLWTCRGPRALLWRALGVALSAAAAVVGVHSWLSWFT
jgi:hypothetical protein